MGSRGGGGAVVNTSTRTCPLPRARIRTGMGGHHDAQVASRLREPSGNSRAMSGGRECRQSCPRVRFSVLGLGVTVR